MGLDMYLRGDKFISTWDNTQHDEHGVPLRVERPQMDGFEVASYVLDLGYWRKFAPLHQFIVQVFANGEDYCQPIDLDAEDLRRIAAAIRDNNLPDDDDCHGFFFGNSELWEMHREQAEEHAQTFEKAAAWIDSEVWNTVTYQASW